MIQKSLECCSHHLKLVQDRLGQRTAMQVGKQGTETCTYEEHFKSHYQTLWININFPEENCFTANQKSYDQYYLYCIA